MKIEEKLQILTDSAKYDVSCSSSGSTRTESFGSLGATHNSGICHAFSADGRCISLLKILFTNYCIYDCSYCINRSSNDLKRAAFTPKEVADLTINFYKRNYIEGLFLSSGIITSEDHTMELILKTLKILRHEYGFNGYVHVKLIPGSAEHLIKAVTKLADRVSSNIELPSQKSLELLAPDKTKEKLFEPLKIVKNDALERGKKVIGMRTQMIIGASPESDYDILKVSDAFYNKGLLKRVYFSAYIPTVSHEHLPTIDTPPPLLREHRLYQADWLMRFYGFTFDEIATQDDPFLDQRFDPKLGWALRNLHHFPVEVNRADKEMLLRVPGFGARSVSKILRARRVKGLTHTDLENMKISLKRARYFITVGGKTVK
ncbi:MAG: putative DNA modification/repair radical SAM protein, partial [Sulfurovum sp.]|nr:putative DNA modification/repair radical SAM protein [Sulfurovum sp.]NNJ45692.1 putative DNA modification/repair radical SAM protein [Sulfurovum sp.]